MSDFYDLLYEVSSETRHMILKELRRRKAGITHISQVLNISQTEASRHVGRLSQIGVIEKDVEGLYGLTLFGDLVYRLLGPFDFVTSHYEYFKDHDVSSVPDSFINRLSELKLSYPNYTSRANIMQINDNVTRVGLESEIYINTILDDEMTEYLMYNWREDAQDQNFQRSNRDDVLFRTILPESFDPSKIPGELLELYIEAYQTGNREYRVFSNLGVVLHSSEKEVSVLAFPLKTGLYDYLGFNADDRSSIRWSADLFDHYWKRSRKINLF